MALVLATGCKSDKSDKKPDKSRAIEECNAVIATMVDPEARTPIHERAVGLSCPSLYAREKCGDAMRDALAGGGGIEAAVDGINTCADEYCSTLGPTVSICRKRLVFEPSGQRPKDLVRQVIELDMAILATELPAREARRLGQRLGPVFGGPTFEVELPPTPNQR